MPSIDLKKILKDLPSEPYQAVYQPVLDQYNQPVETPEGCVLPPFDDRPVNFGPATPPEIDKGCLQPFFPIPVIPIPFIDIPEIHVPCADGIGITGTIGITVNGDTQTASIGQIDDCHWAFNGNFNFNVPIPPAFCPSGFSISGGGINVHILNQDGETIGSGTGAINSLGTECNWHLDGSLNLVINLPNVGTITCPSFSTGYDHAPYISVDVGAHNVGLCSFNIVPHIYFDAEGLYNDYQDRFDQRYCKCQSTNTTNSTTNTTKACCPNGVPGNRYQVYVTDNFEGCWGVMPGWYCCSQASYPTDGTCAGWVSENCNVLCKESGVFDQSSCTCNTTTNCNPCDPEEDGTLRELVLLPECDNSGYGDGYYCCPENWTHCDQCTFHCPADGMDQSSCTCNNTTPEPCQMCMLGEYLVHTACNFDDPTAHWYCCPHPLNSSVFSCSGCYELVCDIIDMNTCECITTTTLATETTDTTTPYPYTTSTLPP